MANQQLPSPEDLRQLLRYDPETGKLFWRVRADVPPGWNTRYADKEAFAINSVGGYKQGGIRGRMYQAHRVIWALHFGAWPQGEIDHINGNRQDNRINNLRDVTKSQNQRNARRRKDNGSGVTGVHRQKNGWVATMCSRSIGYFGCFAQAVKARKQAERDRGFHPNHGRIA